MCRSNYSIAKTHGIEIRSELWGRSVFQPHRTVQIPEEVAHIPYDYVVLATKSEQESAASLRHTLQAVVRGRTTLVSAQNGVGSELKLRQCGFDNPILSATCYISCQQPIPGRVEQISHVKPHAFYIGIHSGGIFSSGEQELDTFSSLDSSFGKVEDAQRQRWEKMVFNASWNPSSVLFDKDTHDLLRDPAAVRAVRALASEAAAVGRAMGVNLSEDLVDATVSGPAKAPRIIPSMLQDFRNGRPLEVDALCGESSRRGSPLFVLMSEATVVRYGRKYGVSIPNLEATYRSLSAINSSPARPSPMASRTACMAGKLIDHSRLDIAPPVVGLVNC